MVAPERKDGVGHRFFRQGDVLVRFKFLNNLVQGHRTLDPEVEPDAVHVLRIEFDRRREQVQIQAHCAEQMPGVSRVMGSEFGVVVATHLRGGDKALFLADVAGAPQTDKTSFNQIIGRFIVQGDGVDENGQIVRVATDDLYETVLVRHEGSVVYAARIHFAETEFAPLGNKPMGR